MSATTETQFTLFNRPSSRDGHQAPRQKRRVQLPDLVRDVGQLENDDLIDLIRVAIGEARRRGIGPASAAGDSSRTMPPVMEQKSPAAARIVRNTAPLRGHPAREGQHGPRGRQSRVQPGTGGEGFRRIDRNCTQTDGALNGFISL